MSITTRTEWRFVLLVALAAIGVSIAACPRKPAPTKGTGGDFLSLMSLSAVLTDAEGRVVMVDTMGDGWILVLDEAGSPEWRSIPASDSPMATDDEPWLQSPTASVIDPESIVVVDDNDILIAVHWGRSFSLVQDAQGNPVWKPVPGSKTPVGGDARAALLNPRVYSAVRPPEQGGTADW